MHVSTPPKWLTFVDRATWKPLLAAVAGSILCFALAYWALSELNPENGLHYPDWEHAVSLGDAIYFSVVTETTLGYGDFAPVGISRTLVVLQVISGLMLAGIVVARITSAQGRAARLLSYKSSGDWLEYWYSDKGAVMLTHATIFTDGTALRYNGENFDAAGNAAGFFYGQLIDGEGQCYRFTYSNRDSTTDHFVEGVCSVMFQPAREGERWSRHTATTHDFGTKRSTAYKGRRATDEEAAVLNGADMAAAAALMRNFGKTVPPHGDRHILLDVPIAS